ncbi:alkaline phosphatase D family protein [Sorangium sp. So ce119]|uniref:alkaline phosphatase D family protein n=1 Tax=Sorangium sp. So ce119 TaxID=3133279 RepID=UPI003F5DDD93
MMLEIRSVFAIIRKVACVAPLMLPLLFTGCSAGKSIVTKMSWSVEDFRARRLFGNEPMYSVSQCMPAMTTDALSGEARWCIDQECPSELPSTQEFPLEGHTFRRCEQSLVAPPPAKSQVESSAAPPPAKLQDEFSFLAWSCDEPFGYHSGQPRIPVPSALSQALLAVRAQGKLVLDSAMPKRPSFALALGDQVYVDTDPDEIGLQEETLAAFGGANSANWRLEGRSKRAGRFFWDLYSAHFLGSPFMRQTLNALPTVMMWDDHEIRDGWGSHGDEGEGEWSAWYKSARSAFVAWQALRNPGCGGAADHRACVDAGTEHAPAHTQFDAGPRVHFFVLDSRSARRWDNKLQPNEQQAVLGDAQLASLHQWLGLDPTKAPTCGSKGGDLWVLGSATPLFVDAASSKSIGEAVRAELEDDLRDSWGHQQHSVEQRKILAALNKKLSACRNDRLLVLSGDIHESGLLALHLGDSLRGWEVVSSGVAADVFEKASIAWVGSKNIYKSTAGWRSTWAGRMAGTPAFAEVGVAGLASDDGTIALKVAWYPSRSAVRASGTSSPNRPLNLAKEAASILCDGVGESHVNATRRDKEVSLGSVLVDTLPVRDTDPGYKLLLGTPSKWLPNTVNTNMYAKASAARTSIDSSQYITRWAALCDVLK